MAFLENTDLLQIEDILPFFPDFVVIDDFKDEICDALEGYAAHIDTLRREMDEATANAAAIKTDIAALQNRFVTIDAGERCAHCKLALLTRHFYVFPCQHSFHADCLIGLVSQPFHSISSTLLTTTFRQRNTSHPMPSGGFSPFKLSSSKAPKLLPPKRLAHPSLLRGLPANRRRANARSSPLTSVRWRGHSRTQVVRPIRSAGAYYLRVISYAI